MNTENNCIHNTTAADPFRIKQSYFRLGNHQIFNSKHVPTVIVFINRGKLADFLKL